MRFWYPAVTVQLLMPSWFSSAGWLSRSWKPGESKGISITLESISKTTQRLFWTEFQETWRTTKDGSANSIHNNQAHPQHRLQDKQMVLTCHRWSCRWRPNWHKVRLGSIKQWQTLGANSYRSTETLRDQSLISGKMVLCQKWALPHAPNWSSHGYNDGEAWILEYHNCRQTQIYPNLEYMGGPRMTLYGGNPCGPMWSFSSVSVTGYDPPSKQLDLLRCH